MRFVVDAQLPPALAHLLIEKGHSAEHVADIGLRDASDTVILWLRIGNASRRALLQWFAPLLPRIETQFEQGEQLVEVR